MAQSKPRKKYNPNKWKMNVAQSISKHSFLFSVTAFGEQGIDVIVNGKPKTLSQVHPVDVDFIFYNPHHWTFILGAACRNQLGKGYLSYDLITLRNQFRFDDKQLKAFVDENMEKVINNVNADHLLTSFFIAFPEKRDVDDDFIQRLIRWKKVETQLFTPFEFRSCLDDATKLLLEIDHSPYIDKATWTILNKHGIENLADLRLYPKHLNTLKGIGNTREKHITDGYIKLLKDRQHDPHFERLISFETHRAMIAESEAFARKYQ